MTASDGPPPDLVTPVLRAPRPVPHERAEAYRSAGLWGSRLRAGIEAAAQVSPERPALVDDRDRLSWRELADAVARCTLALEALGAGPGRAAVLVAGNTVAAAVTFHALLRSGAPTLLLDRRSGTADLRAALDALPDRTLVLLPGSEQERLAPDGTEAVAFEHLAVPSRGEVGRVEREPARDAVAVVLPTSGTTGRPKFVVHSLDTLTAGAANMATITGCDTASTLFLVSPLASITGVVQLVLAADRHATLVLEDDFDPDRSLERIQRHGATMLGGAPVIAERLLAAARARPGTDLPLRTLALGGAMLPRPLLEEATHDFGIEVARVYGSSEAPNHSGSRPGGPRERRLADDGVPTPGAEVRVGSSEHPDEGLVRGPAVFLGYLGPDADTAAFDGDWFRTGDLVEVHARRLTVTGRLKEVVNRNGLKISPAEVEQALADLPEVAEVACFGVPDPATGERLVVAVRPAEGARAPGLSEVGAHLDRRGVARRRWPEELVVWPGPLPRTTSGKVVRSRLVAEAPEHAGERAPRLA